MVARPPAGQLAETHRSDFDGMFFKVIALLVAHVGQARRYRLELNSM
jgi:hypothetical protein